jgi:hypothetical protein
VRKKIINIAGIHSVAIVHYYAANKTQTRPARISASGIKPSAARPQRHAATPSQAAEFAASAGVER